MLNNPARFLVRRSAQWRKGYPRPSLVRFCSEIFPDQPMYRRFVNEARFGFRVVLPVLSSRLATARRSSRSGPGSCTLRLSGKQALRVSALGAAGAGIQFLHRFAEPRPATFVGGRHPSPCRTQDRRATRSRAVFQPSPHHQCARAHARPAADPRQYVAQPEDRAGDRLPIAPTIRSPLEVHFNILLVTRSKPINEWLYKIQDCPLLRLEVRPHPLYRCAGSAAFWATWLELHLQYVGAARCRQATAGRPDFCRAHAHAGGAIRRHPALAWDWCKP